MILPYSLTVTIDFAAIVSPLIDILYSELHLDNSHFQGYYVDSNILEACSEAANAHFKAAIQIRNKAMVERSDMVICCIEHNSGGAYTAVKYAIKLGKKVVNVAEDQE